MLLFVLLSPPFSSFPSSSSFSLLFLLLSSSTSYFPLSYAHLVYLMLFFEKDYASYIKLLLLLCQKSLTARCRFTGFSLKCSAFGTSLVVRWFRVPLSIQGTWVWSLVWELSSHMPRETQPVWAMITEPMHLNEKSFKRQQRSRVPQVRLNAAK